MQNSNFFKLKINERKRISEKLGLNKNKTSLTLNKSHISELKKKWIENKKLIEAEKLSRGFGVRLKNYKYFRNIDGYPSRGQRTHTNAKTKKKTKFKNIL